MNPRSSLGPPLLCSTVALSAGCRPDVGDPDWIVERPRVVAIVADPAEVAPGDDVKLTALVVSPEGEPPNADLGWGLCRAPKPLGENNTISDECLDDAFEPAGQGLEVVAHVPSDACALFGPETPPGEFRPRDPDPTGGFYQPVRVELDGEFAVTLVRLTCRAANAPLESVLELERRRDQNDNPGAFELAATPTSTASDEPIVLSAAFPSDAAERYVLIDPASQRVVERREHLAVSWYTTAGELAEDRTEPDSGHESENVLIPPSSGRVHVWAVLRDDRGGVATASVVLQLE